MNNLAHEFAECAAYYAIASKLIEPQSPATAKQLDEAGAAALAGSTGLTSEAVTNARVEMAAKLMVKELGDSAANFSILLNKYSDPCGQAISDPEARMDYWLNKEG